MAISKIEATMDKVKKRGRKPKGGKIIENQYSDDATDEAESKVVSVQNVILHLRCFRREIEESPTAVVEPYSKETSYECMTVPAENFELSLQEKMTQLTETLRKNEVRKKSDCFWCTCSYTTPPVYIPKGRVANGQYEVYGSFCCPECAAAYVFHEIDLDDCIKFERYHLLNFMYGKTNDYKTNILPAPSPFYMLDKFYGNMTIEEYRKLIQNDKLLLVVDKPICVTCPEIVQSNRNFVEKVGVEGGYRLCRKKKPDSA